MTEKAALFEASTLQLLENCLVSHCLPIKSISIPKEECQSSSPCTQNNFTIINFTEKRLSATWYDYSGIATDNVTFSDNKVGCNTLLMTNSNCCYSIKYDADDPNSETIYIKIPDNKSFYYIGDQFALKQKIYGSSWLNSPGLTVAHIEAFKKLVDYKPVKLTQPEFFLVRSSYYDDSNEFKVLLQTFFDTFNEIKFYDPFFNPIVKLENKVAIRAGEYKVVHSAKPYKPSTFLGSKFKFTLTNDLTADVNVYWIDYAHKKQKLATLQVGFCQPYNSSLGNVFVVNEQQVCFIVEIGVAPFTEDNCSVKMSQLTNIINFDIENPQELINDSVIMNKTHLETYNAKQGQIGNCWFLQCLTSVYARYPKEIVSKFIFPKLMNKTGVVAIKLWSINNKCWRLVILDDYLPYNADSKWYGASPSGPLQNQFWVSLLEKALAKHVDCYFNLTAGQNGSIGVREVHQMILGPLMDSFVYINIPATTDSATFDQFIEYYKNGAVISFSSRNSTSSDLVDNVTGMVSYHGYGLLDVKENVADTGFTLIKAHNVWSQGGEWKGDWGDNSPLWEQYPQVKAELAFENKDDGTFWVEKKDFSRAFSVLWIMTCSQK